MFIAIGHEKRAGKDQFAKFLAEALRGTAKSFGSPKPVRVVSLAKPLKDACAILYPGLVMPGEYYEESNPRCLDKDAIIPALGKSARQVWLDVGKVLNEQDDIVFPRSVILQEPKNSQGKPSGYTIIPDLRRLKETSELAKHTTVFVKVIRPGFTGDDAIPEPGKHALDKELCAFEQWDIFVHNDKDLAALHDKACALAQLIKEPGALAKLDVEYEI